MKAREDLVTLISVLEQKREDAQAVYSNACDELKQAEDSLATLDSPYRIGDKLFRYQESFRTHKKRLIQIEVIAIHKGYLWVRTILKDGSYGERYSKIYDFERKAWTQRVNTRVAFCEKCRNTVYTNVLTEKCGENEFNSVESCEECGHIIREWN